MVVEVLMAAMVNVLAFEVEALVDVLVFKVVAMVVVSVFIVIINMAVVDVSAFVVVVGDAAFVHGGQCLFDNYYGKFKSNFESSCLRAGRESPRSHHPQPQRH